MQTYKEKQEYIAYKLLEWAFVCPDFSSFQQLKQPIKNNALKEAGHILTRLGITNK